LRCVHSFRDLDRHLGLVPAAIARTLGAIDTHRGRQEAYREQNPTLLRTLTEVARIQSTEASNAIEDIKAPRRRIEALVAERTTPANRPEEEIAGYRYVLDTVHSSAEHIPFRRTVVEQFHRDLYRFTPVRAGRFKIGSNQVTETHPDGRVVVRFDPTGPAETPLAMDELHERFERAWVAEQDHRLLLVGAYVFDFLMIHPFQDGNGRMSRLLALLLLYHAGYEVGRFVSLEKLIGDTRETYYSSLQASTQGWHDGEHDLGPWLSYFLGILVAAYQHFEDRVGTVGTHGAKAELVRSYVRSSVKDVFTFDDVRRAAPGVSDVYIGVVLRDLRDAGVLRSESTGRGARWHRLRTSF
jgi:Fic family protein